MNNKMESLSNSLARVGVVVTLGEDTLTANDFTISSTLTGNVLAKGRGVKRYLGTCETPTDVLVKAFLLLDVI